MTVFLNILFVVMSVLFFAGRLYEVIFLMEEGTNFLSQGGIVTTPLMIGIVFLISVCCGVIIYADKKPQDKKLKIPVGIFGGGAAVLFIITSVLNIIRIFTVTGGFLGYDIMMILASAGLMLYGVKGIKGKKSEKMPMVLTILFPLAMCMNAVILNVQPISDTFFLYRSLAAITNLLFFLLLFKNAYSPSPVARPMLYVSGLMNFLISTAANLAGLIGGMVTSSLALADILMNLGLILIGSFSLFTAFYIVPVKEEETAPRTKKAAKPQPVQEYDEYDDEFESTQFAIPVSEPAHTNPAFTQDTEYRQANKISEDTIAMLFAQKEEREQQGVVDTAVKHVTTEIAVTQALEKQATCQLDTATTEFIQPDNKPASATKTEKSVFKSTGNKKPANTKTVYKAPKK